MNRETYNNSLISDGRLDLIVLAKMIWIRRRLIIYITAVFIGVGLIVSFASPVRYTASVSILPQSSSGPDLAGMGALAGLAGINLSSVMSGQTEVSPDIYPSIMQSYPFIYDLMHTPFNFEEEGKMSLYDKYSGDTIPSLGSKLMKYTLYLPRTLMGLLNEDEADSRLDDKIESLNPELKIVDDAMRNVMKRVIMNLSIERTEDGLVVIKGEAGEPVVAAEMTQQAMLLLQTTIVSYKTQQQRENLEFIQTRYLEKKLEYEKAQIALFDFQDANRNRVAERIDFRYQLLSDSYSMAQSIYQNLAQQLEQTKIAVQKETTVFTVVEPVIVPFDRSSPARTRIMIAFIFLGSFAGLMVVLGQVFWKHRSKIF